MNFSLKPRTILKASLGLMAIVFSNSVTSAETVTAPQAIEAPATAAWQHIASSIGERARDLGITVEAGEGQTPIRLFVETSKAFLGDSRELVPAFADFLFQVAILIQDRPDARVNIVGYGDNPANRYNPVQLGLRVRRLRTVLANHGVPFKQIRANVKSHDHYDGPAELSEFVPIGRLIELRFNPH